MKNRIFRISAFARRCLLELVRDPLAYVFALGFPLVMLVVMTLLNESIPPEAGMEIFRIDRLAPAVYVFGLSFLMLFTAILVSKDRAEAFLVRLYISPMQRADFLLGYTLPVLGLAVGQGIVTMLCTAVIGKITDVPLTFGGMALSLAVSLPAVILFVGFGLLFGTLFGDKTAPPLSSVVISLASFLGGMWMDLSQMEGAIVTISVLLPFYHAVSAARMAMTLEFEGILPHLAVTAGWAAAVYLLAIASFRKKV